LHHRYNRSRALDDKRHDNHHNSERRKWCHTSGPQFEIGRVGAAISRCIIELGRACQVCAIVRPTYRDIEKSQSAYPRILGQFGIRSTQVCHSRGSGNPVKAFSPALSRDRGVDARSPLKTCGDKLRGHDARGN
jgi:hypothetical protein